MELKILIVLHVFSAMVWMGGLLIITLGVLPGTYRKNDPERLESIVKPFERIGYPALLIQIFTGVRLAMLRLSPEDWFTGATAASKLISLKFILLILTILLILLDKFFINKQTGIQRMKLMGIQTLAITFVSIILVLTGLSFRFGVFF